MVSIIRFEDIFAWQTARALTRQIYKISSKGEFRTDFGLRDQIRRAAVSIMSNIAEGFESHTRSMFIRYLGIAKASAGEVRSQLYVALDLGYISKEEFAYISDNVRKVSSQLFNFTKYLRSIQQ